MKRSPSSLRRFTTLTFGGVAFAFAVGACSSSNETPAPTPPTVDASTTVDQSTPPPPPPPMDAGGLACGTRTCAGRVVGGQLGLACCTTRMTCGLNFGQGCVDQEDGGGTPMPPADAGVINPDPTCGTLPIDVMGMMLNLSGCCLPDGMCGYYSEQFRNFGCTSLAQLAGFGLPVPDASKACSGDGGGSVPDSGTPRDSATQPEAAAETGTQPEAGTPADGSTPPEGGGSNEGGSSEGGSTEGGPASDSAAPEAGTD